MIERGSADPLAAPALIEQLYPEIATVVLFVVALLCMIALLYISLTWD